MASTVRVGLRASAPRSERGALLSVCALATLGWVLGLAVPVSASANPSVALQALDVIRIVGTTALCVVLVLGPGVVWRARTGRALGLGFVALPGLALLVGTGVVAWVLAGAVSARAVCFVLLTPVLGWVLVAVLRSGPEGLLDAPERRALLITGGVLGLAIARTLWSLGPVGELAGHTIARTLEVGNRPDSTIQFGIVRLVVDGVSPFSAAGRAMQPYDFSTRGPLGGIPSAPVVLLAGGRPTGLPAPWTPFDSQGFMAYRLAMMTFGCTAFLSLWTLTRRLAGDRAAQLALLLAATTPFLVHEVWFTWPKLLAASLVLLAAVALIDGRPLICGLLVGVGYLAHPVALFSLPALVLIALWPLVGARVRQPRVGDALLVVAGAAVGVVGWRLVNWSHYTQSDFLSYFLRAGKTRYLAELYLRMPAHSLGHVPGVVPEVLRQVGGHPQVTFGNWLSDRFASLGNTLIPFRLFVFSAHDPEINAIKLPCFPFCSGNSPGVVHFFFQYWTTLPFGAGILFFGLLLQSLWRAARRWPWPFWAGIVVPFVVFAVYWGDASTGLMREGLQTWILTLLAVVAIEQCASGFGWLKSAAVRAVLALRSLEVLAVAVVPTLATAGRVYDHRFVLSDVVAVASMLLASVALGLAVWRERAPVEDVGRSQFEIVTA